jgi:hypothetical protein
MDPIQPISFDPPTIPPVAPAPRTAGIDRDAARQRDLDRRERQQPRRRRAPQEPDMAAQEGPDHPAAGGDDLGPHIDLRA